MTQFIAHAAEIRTFADKKGAQKALTRDINKHRDAHGDVLFDTGTEIKETADGRFGVVVYCDLTPTEAQTVVGPELSGFVIDASAKPVAVAPTSQPAAKPAKPTTTRRAGEVNISPTSPLLPCRVGSKQQMILDAVTDGATIEHLRKVCLKADGTPWADSSIRSALYYDLKQKGYGITTTWINGDTPSYKVVLPPSYDAPLAPKGGKS